MAGDVGEKELEENLVQVGDADGYQFFLLFLLDDEYAASLDEEYAAEYSSLAVLTEKEMKRAVPHLKSRKRRSMTYTFWKRLTNTLMMRMRSFTRPRPLPTRPLC